MKAGIFASCMLVPVIILVIALVSKARPQQDINSMIGYRSSRSMASQENWDKAQQLMAKYLLAAGVVLTVVSLVFAVFIVNRLTGSAPFIAIAILTVIQVVAVVLVIPFVESGLK